MSFIEELKVWTEAHLLRLYGMQFDADAMRRLLRGYWVGDLFPVDRSGFPSELREARPGIRDGEGEEARPPAFFLALCGIDSFPLTIQRDSAGSWSCEPTERAWGNCWWANGTGGIRLSWEWGTESANAPKWATDNAAFSAGVTSGNLYGNGALLQDLFADLGYRIFGAGAVGNYIVVARAVKPATLVTGTEFYARAFTLNDSVISWAQGSAWEGLATQSDIHPRQQWRFSPDGTRAICVCIVPGIGGASATEDWYEATVTPQPSVAVAAGGEEIDVWVTLGGNVVKTVTPDVESSGNCASYQNITLEKRYYYNCPLGLYVWTYASTTYHFAAAQSRTANKTDADYNWSYTSNRNRVITADYDSDGVRHLLRFVTSYSGDSSLKTFTGGETACNVVGGSLVVPYVYDETPCKKGVGLSNRHCEVPVSTAFGTSGPIGQCRVVLTGNIDYAVDIYDNDVAVTRIIDVSEHWSHDGRNIAHDGHQTLTKTLWGCDPGFHIDQEYTNSSGWVGISYDTLDWNSAVEDTPTWEITKNTPITRDRSVGKLVFADAGAGVVLVHDRRGAEGIAEELIPWVNDDIQYVPPGSEVVTDGARLLHSGAELCAVAPGEPDVAGELDRRQPKADSESPRGDYILTVGEMDWYIEAPSPQSGAVSAGGSIIVSGRVTLDDESVWTCVATVPIGGPNCACEGGGYLQKLGL